MKELRCPLPHKSFKNKTCKRKLGQVDLKDGSKISLWCPACKEEITFIQVDGKLYTNHIVENVKERH